jgi:hypothetical protein
VRKLALTTAAIAAAVAVFVAVTIAPRRLVLQPFDDGTVPGILHVHTNRSDGLSGPDEVAAAAARAGLKFVVFTDHGDATRVPDPPEYRSGVLCLDGVEISTTGGHYIAIGMRPSPYPLGGEPRDVVDDVKRLGGFGIAAHPDSPKPQLRWNGWTTPFDGIEILNLDTSWRVWAQDATAPSGRWAARRTLFDALVDYPFRSPETIGSLIRTGRVASQWAELAAHRRVVTVAGADAHAKLGLRGDPADTRWVLPLPGYEVSFRTMSVRISPARALTGKADADAALVLQAIRDGHLHTVIDSVATPASFEFTARSQSATAREGDELAAGSPATFRVRSNAPAEFTATVWNGTTVVSGGHHERDFSVTAPETAGVYWVEITSTGRRPELAWVTSNPIYVRDRNVSPSVPARPAATQTQQIFDDKTTTGWRVEHDPTSLSAVDAAPLAAGGELRFRFGLAGGSLVGQVAALVFDTPGGIAAYDRLTFNIRGEQPMRVSVQLRNASGARWQRSVFVDTIEQDRTVYLDDVTPAGETPAPQPDLASIRSVLFVVDTTNTKPGASARLWLKRPTFGR